MDVEKDDLLQAGLGEKEVEFTSLDLDADEFRNTLYRAYPQLENAGGFQFSKYVQNSRRLEPLSSVTVSSPSPRLETLVRISSPSKRTWICPLYSTSLKR